MDLMREYQSLDGLPIPTLVVQGERVVYANPAMLELLGVGQEELLSPSGLKLMERLSPREKTWLEPQREAKHRGEPPPDTVWMQMRVASGEERAFYVRRGAGARPEDTLMVLLDAEAEASVRRLTEALARSAGELVSCRDEQTVLEKAVEAIHQQGFYVAVMLLEGDTLVHGPMRQKAEVVAALEQIYGCPNSEIRLPLSNVPHIEQAFTWRKATFHQDIFLAMERFHTPEALTLLRRTFSSLRVLEAPIFVEGEPYALLTIQGEALTPVSAATMELFGTQIGGALENVRHHRLAASRLSELSRLQAELVAQERLNVLGEAAGVVAHEVRNPLGAILNVVAVLKREKLGSLGASAVEILEEEATRLDAIVRDLLDVVRPLEPRPRTLHLGELVQRTVTLFRERRQLEKVRLELDEEPDLPPLSADETLLQMALENLVRNAVQASPPGGTVRVAVARAPEGLLLTVEDEGPGISPTDVPRIFEPFFTTRSTGTGLGLAVVRRVVLAHGGTVSVGQRPGGGARFELRLPLAVEARSPPVMGQGNPSP